MGMARRLTGWIIHATCGICFGAGENVVKDDDGNWTTVKCGPCSGTGQVPD